MFVYPFICFIVLYLVHKGVQKKQSSNVIERVEVVLVLYADTILDCFTLTEIYILVLHCIFSINNQNQIKLMYFVSLSISSNTLN